METWVANHTILLSIISGVILLTTLTFDMKYEKNPKEYINYYICAYVFSLIPVANIIILLLSTFIFLIICIYELTKKIILYMINYFDVQQTEKEKKELLEVEKYEILKNHLIKTKYFKNQDEIDMFVDGIKVSNKLTKSINY